MDGSIDLADGTAASIFHEAERKGRMTLPETQSLADEQTMQYRPRDPNVMR